MLINPTCLAVVMGIEVVFADIASEESEDKASVANELGVKGWAKRNKANCVGLVDLVAMREVVEGVVG